MVTRPLNYIRPCTGLLVGMICSNRLELYPSRWTRPWQAFQVKTSVLRRFPQLPCSHEKGEPLFRRNKKTSTLSNFLDMIIELLNLFKSPLNKLTITIRGHVLGKWANLSQTLSKKDDGPLNISSPTASRKNKMWISMHWEVYFCLYNSSLGKTRVILSPHCLAY